MVLFFASLLALVFLGLPAILTWMACGLLGATTPRLRFFIFCAITALNYQVMAGGPTAKPALLPQATALASGR